MSCNKELKNLINKAIWRKTDYIKPHEYVLIREYLTLYLLIKEMIKELGRKGTFRGKEYTYLDFEGYKYWVVGNILNRQKLETKEGPNLSAGKS